MIDHAYSLFICVYEVMYEVKKRRKAKLLSHKKVQINQNLNMIWQKRKFMHLKITDGELGVRPPVTKPHPGFFHQVGEARFRKLVDDHYELIRHSDIAFLFPVNDEDDFELAKKHAADFFIQICGGHAYFQESRGEPRMVGRHAPFRIDEPARRRWLELYAQLLPELEKEGISEEYILSFWNYIDIFSMWMINTK